MTVAPLVGAWIEINSSCIAASSSRVAPLVGAWIEISAPAAAPPARLSLPSWERGLKYAHFEFIARPENNAKKAVIHVQQC